MNGPLPERLYWHAVTPVLAASVVSILCSFLRLILHREEAGRWLSIVRRCPSCMRPSPHQFTLVGRSGSVVPTPCFRPGPIGAAAEFPQSRLTGGYRAAVTAPEAAHGGVSQTRAAAALPHAVKGWASTRRPVAVCVWSAPADICSRGRSSDEITMAVSLCPLITSV